jgi:hypothetical protein
MKIGTNIAALEATSVLFLFPASDSTTLMAMKISEVVVVVGMVMI